jgi:hypothetical protein
MAEPKDFLTMMADARLPERTVPICLRGDLTAAHEELERKLEDAQRRPVDSLEGNGTGELAEQILALEAAMRDHSYTFVVRALPKPAWRKFVAEHGPRVDPVTGDPDAGDVRVGFNQETFYDDVVRACVIDPVLDSAGWTELLDTKLTDRQIGDLADAAWAVNRGTVDVPFSHAASRSRRATDGE